MDLTGIFKIRFSNSEMCNFKKSLPSMFTLTLLWTLLVMQERAEKLLTEDIVARLA